MLDKFNTAPISGVVPSIINLRKIDKLLFCICNQLNLTKAQRERAEKAYEIVADILRAAPEDSILYEVGVRIYAQGSLLTGTTVRPVHGDEFDLDVVILFDLDSKEIDPRALQDEIFNLLKKDGRYKDIVEKKSRCIRINYKTAFHIDMMPACPEFLEFNDDGILVPFKKSETLFIWQPSNPLGIGKWLSQMDAKATKLYNLMEKSARADVEVDPFPINSKEFSILRSIIGMLKRNRDQFFKDDDDSAKIARSIALLVMAGEFYDAKGSILLDLKHIVVSIEKHTSNYMNLHVYNPLHNDRLPEYREDFAEKWRENRGLYLKFRKWILNLLEQINALENMKVSNYTDYTELLKEMFNIKVVDDALNEFATTFTTSQQSGSLKMVNKITGAGSSIAAGLSTSSNAGTVVKANKFYGGSLPFKIRRKSLPAVSLWGQSELFKTRLPLFDQKYDRKNKEMTWVGNVRPTIYSDTYKIKIVYKEGFHPKVYVVSHDIGEKCIHTYSNKRLCLYHLTKDKDAWKSNQPITDTIVPWAILWLLHWEIWKVTGVWNGEEFVHERAA